jgi:hypothetical protein
MCNFKIFFLVTVILLTVTVTIKGQSPSGTPPPGDGAGLHIGDNFGGGRVFWLDESGRHGLIAPLSDQNSEGIAWNPGTSVVTGASADSLYAGERNTMQIMKVQGTSSGYAARLCSELVINSGNMVYRDWYLPSKKELQLLFQQKQVIGGFNTTSGIYWSSTESKATPHSMAWEQEFKYGSQFEDDKDLPNQVRCIRKF